jgi:hypothetical protein
MSLRAVRGAVSQRRVGPCVVCSRPYRPCPSISFMIFASNESLVIIQRPERVFTCPAPVESVVFHPHLPHLLIGGTYSGTFLLTGETLSCL